MQQKLHRQLVIISSVLVSFGFFYLLRDGIFREYSAQSGRSQLEAGDALLFADALSEPENDRVLAARRAEDFYARGDYEAAEKVLLRSIQREGESAEQSAFLGRVRAAAGDNEGAERYFARACELDPASVEIIIERANNLVGAGKEAEAEKLLAAALEKNSDEDVIYQLILIRLDLGQASTADLEGLEQDEYAEQIGIIQDYLIRGASDDSASGLVRRAAFFCRLGETGLALADIDRVLAREDKYRDAYLIRGKALQAIGDTAGAEASFEKVLELDADNLEAILYLEGIYAAAGDVVRADDFRSRRQYLER